MPESYSAGSAASTLNASADSRAGNRTYSEFKKEDCPVCKHRGWCSKADDGSAVVCRRQAVGAAFEGRDAHGTPFYIHALVNTGADDSDDESRKTPKLSGPTPKAAPPKVRDEVYTALLFALKLGDHHREDLKLRGLSDEVIVQNNYRSLGANASARRPALVKLGKTFDRATLLKVPGLYLDDKKALAICSLPGLLIPVCDYEGRIVALKVRPDKRLDGGKYLWLSSKKWGGPSSGSPCHVPESRPGGTVVRLTEGELKADIATALSDVLTVSVSGVSNWRTAVPTLKSIGRPTVRVAFDADASVNALVSLATSECCRGLAALGYTVEVERWGRTYGNGIDNVLAAGKPTEVLTGPAVEEHLRGLAQIHKVPEAAPITNGHTPDGSSAGFAGGLSQECPKFEGPIRPLTAELLTVPTLPPAMIPMPLRGWLTNIARRGCFPLEYPTAAAFVGLSSLIGRNLTIKPKRHDNWAVVPNTWGAIVGPPGVQKSPAVEETMTPMKRLVAEAIEAHGRAEMQALEDAAVAEAKAGAAKKKLADAAKKGQPDHVLRIFAAEANHTDDAPAPTAKRYIVNDATVEKLGELLRENPRGLFQFRDELTGFFRSMDRQGHESDRGFYLESWNGNGSYTFDRIGRGTIHINALCLSLFGTIQPGPLARYLKGAASGDDADGFMPRFQLLLYPDPPSRFVNVDEWPDAKAKNTAFEVYRWIDAMDPASLGAELDEDSGLSYLRFDDDAQRLFDEWRTELENRLRSASESALLTCHLSKYRSLMPSLALLFHVVSSVGTERLTPVSEAAAEAAAAWCELLEAHARRIYQAAVDGDPEAAARLADRIKKSLPNPFTYRQVAKKGWAGLDDDESVRKAVGILEDRNWAKVILRQPVGGGRPSEEVWVNPEVHEGEGVL